MRVTLGEVALYKNPFAIAQVAMSLKNRQNPVPTLQNKIPTNPPPPCKNGQHHGPSVQGRKDHLCKNCAKFADKQAERTAEHRARAK